MYENLAAALESWLSNPFICLSVSPSDEIKRLREQNKSLAKALEQMTVKYCDEVQRTIQLVDKLREVGYHGKIV